VSASTSHAVPLLTLTLSRLREREGPIAQQWEGEGLHRRQVIPHPSHPFGMGPFPLPLAGEGSKKARSGACHSTDASRTGDPRAAEPAVAVRILGEVLLVVILGVIEGRRLADLGGDGAVAGGG